MKESIHHVSIRKNNGYNLLSRAEFLDMPKQERNSLILNKKVQFLDADGGHIPLLEGIRSISIK
jgi:transcription elongation GreA/GreB family factor